MGTMALITTSFPKLFEKNEIAQKMAVIYELLKDLTSNELNTGVIKFCKNHKEIYPNTNIVAYIREYALLKDYPSAASQWEFKFIQDIASPITKRIVQSMGGRFSLDRSTNASTDRAHFLKLYEQLVNEEKQATLNKKEIIKPKEEIIEKHRSHWTELD